MDVLNTTISQFDAELKQLISEKINAELQSAIQTMVAETVPSIVGIKCNEFLNKSHTVLEPICETDYAHYVETCKKYEQWLQHVLLSHPQGREHRTRHKIQSREQIVYFISDEHGYNPKNTKTYVIFKNGKILNFNHNHGYGSIAASISCSKYDLTYEPSNLFITLFDWCWGLYFRTLREDRGVNVNGITKKFTISRAIQNYDTAEDMIIPLIELFTKEKPHELNLEVKNLLRLEDALNIREVELHEREMDISLREMEMDNTLKRLEQEKQEYMHEKNKEIEECKNAKKQIMEKFIAQERQIKQLNKQLEEITELYNVLIG